MTIGGLGISLGGRHTETDHRGFVKLLTVGRRVQHIIKQLTMQIPKPLGHAKRWLVFVMRQQPYTKVIIAHIGRKTVTHDAIDSLLGLGVKDNGF